jgi:hypothetical protein
MPTARKRLSRTAALLGLLAILLRLLAPALHTCDHAHAHTAFGGDSHVGCSHAHGPHAHHADAAGAAQDDAECADDDRPAHRSADVFAHDACAVCGMFASSEGCSTAERSPPSLGQLVAKACIALGRTEHASAPRSAVHARAPPRDVSACCMPHA